MVNFLQYSAIPSSSSIDDFLSPLLDLATPVPPTTRHHTLGFLFPPSPAESLAILPRRTFLQRTCTSASIPFFQMPLAVLLYFGIS